MPAFGSLPFIVLALLGFGFVIAIHEFGHFLFAKLAGVKVLRFSIGFGPILWSKQVGETEYSLSLLPLGGYVKMLGEDNPAQGATEPGASTDPRSYVNASRPWKALILLGGVTFNLASSWLILVGLAFHGMPMTPPIVADVEAVMTDPSGKTVSSPARRLDLQQGDVVVAVNGKNVRSFDDIRMCLAAQSGEPVTLRVRRAGAEVDLPRSGEAVYAIASGGLPALGVHPPIAPSIEAVARGVGEPRPDDPQPGERIVAIDGERLGDDVFGQQIEERLRPLIGRPVRLGLRDEKGHERETPSFTYFGGNIDLTLETPVVITRVLDATPAQAAGIRPADIVESVDGEPVRSPNALFGLVARGLDRDIALRVLRGTQHLDIVVHAADLLGSRRIGMKFAPLDVGVLPFLPPALDGGAGALAAAGFKPGEALMARLPQRDGADAKPVWLALSGAEQVAVALEEGDDVHLVHKRSFGRSSIATRLFATRVDRWLPAPTDSVDVQDADGVHQIIALDALSPLSRGRLREALAPGDWIAGNGIGADGRTTLVALRGATTAPRVLDVQKRTDGVAIALTPLFERPYHLSSPGEAFAIANDAAVDMVVNTLQLIPRFFHSADKGGIDATQTLSGPIGIFTQFKIRAERLGFASFLKLVAVIGLNLFLVNLLPIPIVDGGQLVFLAIEAVIRRPVPDAVRAAANYAGFALVLALMAFSLGIDIWRQLGWL